MSYPFRLETGPSPALIIPVQRSTRAARAAVRNALGAAGLSAGAPIQGKRDLRVPLEALTSDITAPRLQALLADSLVHVYPMGGDTPLPAIEALGRLPGVGGAYRGEGLCATVITPDEFSSLLAAHPRPDDLWDLHNGAAYLHAALDSDHGFDAETSLAVLGRLPNGTALRARLEGDATPGRGQSRAV